MSTLLIAVLYSGLTLIREYGKLYARSILNVILLSSIQCAEVDGFFGQAGGSRIWISALRVKSPRFGTRDLVR